MEKTFERMHLVNCTAIGSTFCGGEAQRTDAILCWSEGRHDGDCVIFGWPMPETAEDADAMIQDAGSDADGDVAGCLPIIDGMELGAYIASVYADWRREEA